MPRLLLLLIAFGLALLSAVFFDRFNPARVFQAKAKPTKPGETVPLITAPVLPAASMRLTPITARHNRFRFFAIFISEQKLFLKGQRWWWYTVALGLIAAQLSSGLEDTRIMLILSWLWPILILSGLGCREARHNTRQIVFSAPHPVMNQLPAAWLSALVVLALLGSGALLRFILAGETISIIGWITAIVFIPSLALASGVLTSSSKAFEVMYVLWMYLLTQKAPGFDFMGMTPESPWYIYAPLAGVLLLIAAFARSRQLSSRQVFR
jgi:hypothetical protein